MHTILIKLTHMETARFVKKGVVVMKLSIDPERRALHDFTKHRSNQAVITMHRPIRFSSSFICSHSHATATIASLLEIRAVPEIHAVHL